MKTKMRKFLGTTAASGVLALMVAPGTATAMDNIRWQIPMSFASTLTALGDTMPWVADQLRLVSDGAIDMRIAEPGAVVPALAIFESVADGSIDAGYS